MAILSRARARTGGSAPDSPIRIGRGWGAQLVLCGAIVQVTGRTAMEAPAAPMPGRWGYAQSASTIDLTRIRVPSPGAADDWLWLHGISPWPSSAGALAEICLVSRVVTALVLRRQRANA